jgi:hypothetical protein
VLGFCLSSAPYRPPRVVSERMSTVGRKANVVLDDEAVIRDRVGSARTASGCLTNGDRRAGLMPHKQGN